MASAHGRVIQLQEPLISKPPVRHSLTPAVPVPCLVPERLLLTIPLSSSGFVLHYPTVQQRCSFG